MGGSITQTRSERVPTPSYDLPLLGVHTPGSDEERGHTLRSGEDSIELIKELMKTYTKLSERVLALEGSKAAQDLVITRLKLRVMKLEKKKKKARTPQPLKRRSFKVRVESSTEENLDEKDPSKHRRRRFDDETDFDAGFYKVQVTPTQSYTRRRRAISTGSGGISIASSLFSTTKESVSTVGTSMPVSTTGMVREFNINIPSQVAVKIKMKNKDKGWLEFMKQINLLLRKNGKTLKKELKLMKS
nr:hypothetical protein [Tanacetum cinerariifolium]